MFMYIIEYIIIFKKVMIMWIDLICFKRCNVYSVLYLENRVDDRDY